MPQMMNLMWLPQMIYFSMAMMMIFNMKTPFIKNDKYETKKIKIWSWQTYSRDLIPQLEILYLLID